LCSAEPMQHLHATGVVRSYTQCIPRENAIRLYSAVTIEKIRN